nr:MAG TPA: hypothetical protein [Caudoviricetes sp.]
MSRPQDKNLIPLTERSEEEAHAIRSAGGKASQAARKKRTEQQYLLGKYAQAPILDKRTIKKFERLGFESEEINRALEITDAIMKGAKTGDPRMIEIYLRLTGEEHMEAKPKENNLLEAIQNATKEDVNTDDLPELQQAAASDADVVE